MPCERGQCEGRVPNEGAYHAGEGGYRATVRAVLPSHGTHAVVLAVLPSHGTLT